MHFFLKKINNSLQTLWKHEYFISFFLSLFLSSRFSICSSHFIWIKKSNCFLIKSKIINNNNNHQNNWQPNIWLTGNYSRLACEIQFVRSMGYYLIQIYIPSGLIVIISWVSFWLNRNATPARVALGVTTVLTMTTLMSSTNAALPKISYVKSIDVYLGTCFVMVFASLLGKYLCT